MKIMMRSELQMRFRFSCTIINSIDDQFSSQGCAIMGALLVPLSFLTVWEMTFSLPASTLSGLLILLGTLTF
jgi:dolichyl-phosphate-mannose--protein O-mannosyl transferase